MPSKSKAQHRLMEAACHGTAKTNVPKDVACEYSHADKGRTKNLPERKKGK